MAKPYSMDLRERAMRRVDAGGSARSVAAALSVAPSTVVKWSQRRRATGAVLRGGSAGVGLARSWASMRRGCGSGLRGDFTLRGLVAELAERGLGVDYRTMWTLRPLRGTELQKKPRSPASRTGPTSRGAAHVEGLSGRD